MKKSFLITLAAVSSVALIGCSSSSDDNNGGNGGNATAEATVATVKSVKKDQDYYVNAVTPLANSKGEALNMEVTCAEGTDVALILKDEAKNLLVIEKTNAEKVAKNCSVKLVGEGANGEATLDFTADSNESDKTFTVVKKDTTDALSEITLTKGVDDATTYNVTAKEAGTIAKDSEASFTYTEGTDFADFKIDASEALKAGDTNAVFTTKDKTFTLDPSKATKALTAQEVIFKANSGDTQLGNIAVEIQTNDPALTIDETKVVAHASDTKHVFFPVKKVNFEDAITGFTCKVDKENNGTFEACGSDLAIAGNTDKSGVYVDLAKVNTLLGTKANAKIEISATIADTQKTITPIVKPLSEIKQILQPKVSVFKVGSATRAGDEDITEKGLVDIPQNKAIEIKVVANKLPLVSYSATDDQESSKTEYNGKGTVINFQAFALAGADSGEFTIDESGITDSEKTKCKEGLASKAGTECYTAIKLTNAPAKPAKTATLQATVAGKATQDVLKLTGKASQ